MKRRIAALAACMLLLLSVGSLPAAQAMEDFYFVAVNGNVLPLTDSTMPFWDGGYLYIAASIFTGTVRETLDITYSRNEGKNVVVLYRRNGDFIFTDTRTCAVQDASGGRYAPDCIERDGTVFISVALVADFFGLDYSVLKVNRGHLVWLRKKDFGMSERDFANAASFPVESRYQQYMKQRPQEPPAQEETPPPAVEPEQPSQPEQPGQSEQQRIHLCLSAGEDTPALLDELDRKNAGAAIFCTPEFMQTHADLLRRMVASGYAVGVEADTLEQLEAGNDLLQQATMSRTRFARMANAEEAQRTAAREAGWCLLQEDLDRSGYDLRTLDQARSLMQSLSGRGSTVSVYLGQRVSAAGLQRLLSLMAAAENRCMTLTENSCR